MMARDHKAVHHCWGFHDSLPVMDENRHLLSTRLCPQTKYTGLSNRAVRQRRTAVQFWGTIFLLFSSPLVESIASFSSRAMTELPDTRPDPRTMHSRGGGGGGGTQRNSLAQNDTSLAQEYSSPPADTIPDQPLGHAHSFDDVNDEMEALPFLDQFQEEVQSLVTDYRNHIRNAVQNLRESMEQQEQSSTLGYDRHDISGTDPGAWVTGKDGEKQQDQIMGTRSLSSCNDTVQLYAPGPSSPAVQRTKTTFLQKLWRHLDSPLSLLAFMFVANILIRLLSSLFRSPFFCIVCNF